MRRALRADCVLKNGLKLPSTYTIDFINKYPPSARASGSPANERIGPVTADVVRQLPPEDDAVLSLRSAVVRFPVPPGDGPGGAVDGLEGAFSGPVRDAHRYEWRGVRAEVLVKDAPGAHVDDGGEAGSRLQSGAVIVSVLPGFLGGDVVVAVVVQGQPAGRAWVSVQTAERRLANISLYNRCIAFSHHEIDDVVFVSDIETCAGMEHVAGHRWIDSGRRTVDVDQRFTFSSYPDVLRYRRTRRVVQYPGLLCLVIQAGQVDLRAQTLTSCPRLFPAQPCARSSPEIAAAPVQVPSWPTGQPILPHVLNLHAFGDGRRIGENAVKQPTGSGGGEREADTAGRSVTAGGAADQGR